MVWNSKIPRPCCTSPQPEYPRARGLTASYYIDRNIRERENVHAMADGIRVLYVDDMPGLLEIARLFLEQTGEFFVTTAESAEEALASRLPLHERHRLRLPDAESR